MTRDDDPFESSVHFTLLGQGLEEADRVSLGVPYQTGTFRLLRTGPGDSLEFSFFADEVWHLDVLKRARFVLFGSRTSIH